MPLPKDKTKIEEYKKRLSEIAKAKGYGKWMKGRHLSKETKKKLSRIGKQIGNTPEERERRSKRAKKLGVGKWMKGRKNTPFLLEAKKEAKRRKGKTYKQIYGDRAKEEALKRKLSNRKRWVGKRKANLRPKHNSDYRYTEWRDKVFKRDNYTCQICFKKGGYLEAHHIKPWAKYPKLRYKVSNGLTVHKGECHKKATCVERIEAFQQAGVPDPTEYDR